TFESTFEGTLSGKSSGFSVRKKVKESFPTKEVRKERSGSSSPADNPSSSSPSSTLNIPRPGAGWRRPAWPARPPMPKYETITYGSEDADLVEDFGRQFSGRAFCRPPISNGFGIPSDHLAAIRAFAATGASS